MSRDERHQAMERWLGAGATLVSAKLEIPGARELPHGAMPLFLWGLEQLKRALPAARRVFATSDVRGPFELWSTPGAATTVKRRCVAVEDSIGAARLLHLDVFTPDGALVDRASLHIAPRTCLCCAAPGLDCLEAARHPPAALLSTACELLARFRS